MAEQELFQCNRPALSARFESKSAGTQTADRPRGNFERPDTGFVQTKFGMDWTVRKTHRRDGSARATFNLLLLRGRVPRRCDVNRLFKVRPCERVRLIEDSQDMKRTVGEQTFDGNFVARNVTFDDRVVEIGF